MNIGIKMSKPGVDVTTATPKDLILDSKYSMLKYESDNTGSIAINPGDTNKYVDFPHSLGYVPSFIAYLNYNGLHFISLPSSGAAGLAQHAYAYADNTKVRCGYYFDVGAYKQYSQSFSDSWNTFYSDNHHFSVGRTSFNFDGALRFTGINIPQGTTITSAVINVAIDFKGAGVGDMLIQTWGIAEDNTSSFSDPMGRTTTTAVTTQNVSLPPVGSNFGINVTSQVQEILNRAGWSASNAMGFIIRNNGSPDNVWVQDNPGTGNDSTLTITFGTGTTLTFRTIIFKDKIA